ncbi:hypothetical protein CEXT_125881 [Caerostris extrusa]|uniref:Uncharacterized protein n=1 Tax=Caerostris extrusa TaxID=172846 RepID=A0AAV4QNB6_CAEEX|nr:hypothetical protein CEXT_125881 [Caerostris extrusa]
MNRSFSLFILHAKEKGISSEEMSLFHFCIDYRSFVFCQSQAHPFFSGAYNASMPQIPPEVNADSAFGFKIFGKGISTPGEVMKAALLGVQCFAKNNVDEKFFFFFFQINYDLTSFLFMTFKIYAFS